MNETVITTRQPDDISSEETRAFDLVIVLARFKKIVVGVPLIVAVSAAIISVVLPNVYKASAKLLPPQQSQSGAAALLSQLGGMSGLAAGVAGLKNPNDLYVGMLTSRTVADRLIQRFDLKKAYGFESQEKTRKELETNTVITSGKDGLITIEVEDKNQKLVAGLTNGYVDELLKLTKTLAVTEASQRRLFFEQQLELAKNNLAAAEIKLKSSLDVNGVVSVEGESRAIVESLAKMRAQISAKEVELKSMQAFVTANNPNYLRVQEQLNSLRGELSKLENGRADDGASPANGGNVKGLENIKTLRDVKYFQMLYELLSKQYEIARLDEAKDPSIIQVLDPAVEPERKIKPKRAFIVVLSTLLAFFASVILAFILDAKQRAMRKPGTAARWKELKALLRP